MTYDKFTITYDPTHNIQLDAHVPKIEVNNDNGNLKNLPAVVSFHGGGLVAGSKDDLYFPRDLADKFLSQNVIFISPNYRLLYPSTGFDILADVHVLFDYLASDSSELGQLLAQKNTRLDISRIGVIGFSGGNYPARISLMDSINPLTRPKVHWNLYGMGGDFLLDHWINVKPPNKYVPDLPFFKEKVEGILNDPKYKKEKNGLSEAHLGVEGDERGRMGLFVWFINQGNILDVLLDQPGLSARLRSVPYDQRIELLDDEQIKILSVILPTTQRRPKPMPTPTIIIHGENDRIVPIEESYKHHHGLKELGASKVKTIWVKDAGHGLFVDGQWPKFIPGVGSIMDQGVEFVMEELNKA
ncbi:uncharacterized protein L199_004683 [Kwoniella botswanensis]|uniref:uncharacterized protein n=1 Tax=Kwoniella botswanensis TaxID=1268659 RepID=UPI00315D1CAA